MKQFRFAKVRSPGARSFAPLNSVSTPHGTVNTRVLAARLFVIPLAIRSPDEEFIMQLRTWSNRPDPVVQRNFRPVMAAVAFVRLLCQFYRELPRGNKSRRLSRNVFAFRVQL